MIGSRLAARIDTIGAKKKIARIDAGWPSSSRPDLKFFETRKARYRFRERGAGPTIVFSVDPPILLESYDALIDLFAERYRVIAFELPAMGFSVGKNAYGFGFEESAEDLAVFLDSIAGPASILAFSCASGLAAVEIARTRPELVAALVLFQTTDWQGFQNWRTARDPKRILAKPFIGQIAMQRLARTRAPAWFALSVGVENQRDRLCRCAEAGLKDGAGWALASAYQRYLGPRSAPLPPAPQPTLVIWGDADRSHGQDAAERARNLSTHGARVVRLSGVGHFPELESTEAVFDLVNEFVDEAAERF